MTLGEKGLENRAIPHKSAGKPPGRSKRDTRNLAIPPEIRIKGTPKLRTLSLVPLFSPQLTPRGGEKPADRLLELGGLDKGEGKQPTKITAEALPGKTPPKCPFRFGKMTGNSLAKPLISLACPQDAEGKRKGPIIFKRTLGHEGEAYEGIKPQGVARRPRSRSRCSHPTSSSLRTSTTSQQRPGGRRNTTSSTSSTIAAGGTQARHAGHFSGNATSQSQAHSQENGSGGNDAKAETAKTAGAGGQNQPRRTGAEARACPRRPVRHLQGATTGASTSTSTSSTSSSSTSSTSSSTTRPARRSESRTEGQAAQITSSSTLQAASSSGSNTHRSSSIHPSSVGKGINADERLQRLHLHAGQGQEQEQGHEQGQGHFAPMDGFRKRQLDESLDAAAAATTTASAATRPSDGDDGHQNDAASRPRALTRHSAMASRTLSRHASLHENLMEHVGDDGNHWNVQP